MPDTSGNWTWNHFRQEGSAVVAVMLARPGQSIALTFKKPDGWGTDLRADEEFVRALLMTAGGQEWSLPRGV